MASAEDTRRSLVLAALGLFGRKGFEGASTREIAAAAGANIGSIAYHFGGKQQLYRACAAYIVETIGMTVSMAMGAGNPVKGGRLSPEAAKDRLVGIANGVVEFLVVREETGDIVQFVLRELQQPSAAMTTIQNELFNPVHARICALWEAATGEPAESERTKLTVFSLIGQLVYFRIARVAIGRRMGWKEIGRNEAGAVLEVIRENMSDIIDARRAGWKGEET